MKNSYVLFVILSLLSAHFFHGFSMETGVMQSTNCQSVSYVLPPEVDRNKLIESSVMIECGFGRSTGVAIGDRYILTAAHTIAAYALIEAKINCFCVKSANDKYIVPISQTFVNAQQNTNYLPDYSACKTLRFLNIVKAHFPKGTYFKEVDETEEQETMNLGQFLEKYEESMEYGIESAEKLASSGVSTGFMKEGEFIKIAVRTFGPDVAILECDTPHNLPTIPISDPIEERMMVHILGLTGLRYRDNSSSSSSNIVGGMACVVHKEIAYVFQPRIIGQRFKCLPGFPSGEKCWINRAFMKVVNKKYLLEEAIYPNSPPGFGLIASGDSGAGGFIVQDGQPLLVGVVSIGHIEPVFIGIQNWVLSVDANKLPHTERPLDEKLRESYCHSQQTKNTNEKWFITQGLADVTQLKNWINDIIVQ